MIKNGDNVILKFSTIWDGELCRDHGKAYIYPSMDRAVQYCHPGREVLVEYTPVKHGRWYLVDDGDGAVCSECGTDFCALLNEVMRFKYCPNCGAYMRETYGD